MASLDKISITLEARTQDYNARLKAAQALTRTTFNDMSRSALKMQKSVNVTLGKLDSAKQNKNTFSLDSGKLQTIAMMAPDLSRKNTGGTSDNSQDTTAREREAIEKLITQLAQEKDMIGLVDEARQKALKTKETHTKLSTDDEKSIAALTDQSMAYRATINESVDALGNNNEALQAFKDVSSETTKTFLNGMKKGKTATDALSDAVKKLMQNLLQSGFNALTKGIGGGGGLSGIFSGLFSGLGSLFGFSEGGYTGTGGKFQPAGLVHKGEVVWSQADVKRWGGAHIVDGLRRGYAEGGIVGSPSLPSAPAPKTQTGSVGTQTVRVLLQDDSGRMAAIADQRIQTKSGAIVEVAVKQSVHNVKRNINAIAQEGQTRYG